MIYQGIEYQVRASLGRDEWVLLIYFPDKPDGKATVSKFTGTRAVVAGAARRKIDNWLSEKKRKALQPKRPAEDRAATTRQHVSHTAKPPRPRVRRCRHQIQ